MVAHTLAALAAVPSIVQTLVVIAPRDELFAQQVQLPSAHFSVASCAGNTRAETVLNGIKALLEKGTKGQDWVLVHDAARCLTLPVQIEALIAACVNPRAGEGAHVAPSQPVGALLALPLADTLKQAQDNRVLQTLERQDKWLAQTPQMFRLQSLHDALAQALVDDPQAITDEASAMERAGHQPLLVRGSSHNFKITYPEDFALAQAVLKARSAT